MSRFSSPLRAAFAATDDEPPRRHAAFTPLIIADAFSWLADWPGFFSRR